MTSLMRLGLSLGLAGAAGARTYLPLLVVGLLSRFSETLSYRQPFTVFASVPVLLLLIGLAGYELLAHHFAWNSGSQVVITIGIRALGGAVIFAGLSRGIGTFWGLLIGGAVAVVSHILTVRLKTLYIGGTVGRAGDTGSGFEETVAVAGTVLAMLLPWTSYLIWIGILLAMLKKTRHNNKGYRPEAKAKTWR